MTPVIWHEQQPYNPRFDDIYRSQGLAQTQEVFLRNCELLSPLPRWSQHAKWCILETGFGLGLNFLGTWLAWRNDPQRPQSLDYVGIEAYPVNANDILKSAQPWPLLQPLARQLAQQWYGLTPGFHLLTFEHGRLRLLLCIDEIDRALENLTLNADSIFLDGFAPKKNPAMWSLNVMQSLKRLSMPHTLLASWCVAASVRHNLTTAGFSVSKATGLAPKRHSLKAAGAPQLSTVPQKSSPSVAVVGAGLAGSTVAQALSARGARVTLYHSPKHNIASHVSAGLFTPHIAFTHAKERPITALCRSGIRLLSEYAQKYLIANHDWALSGVLELRKKTLDANALTSLWHHQWSSPATIEILKNAHLNPLPNNALWHKRAGWVRPKELCAALQKNHHIVEAEVTVIDYDNILINDMHYDACVICNGVDSALLLKNVLPKNALAQVRGQFNFDSWRLHPLARHQMPTFPVNGNGSFIPYQQQNAVWGAGSTYEHQIDHSDILAESEHYNRLRLLELLPQSRFLENQPLAGFAALRCTSKDRLPLVGALRPNLFSLTALGSRGISIAFICAELIAAQITSTPEPLPQTISAQLHPLRF